MARLGIRETRVIWFSVIMKKAERENMLLEVIKYSTFLKTQNSHINLNGIEKYREANYSAQINKVSTLLDALKLLW